MLFTYILQKNLNKSGGNFTGTILPSPCPSPAHSRPPPSHKHTQPPSHKHTHPPTHILTHPPTPLPPPHPPPTPLPHTHTTHSVDVCQHSQLKKNILNKLSRPQNRVTLLTGSRWRRKQILINLKRLPL